MTNPDQTDPSEQPEVRVPPAAAPGAATVDVELTPAGDPATALLVEPVDAVDPVPPVERVVEPVLEPVLEPILPGGPARPATATATDVGAAADGALVEPSVAAPSVDVATAATSTLPGEHRGGFQREFTEPVPITASTHSELQWAPAPPPPLPRSAPWALTFGVLGLIVSFLVGWGFLIGLVGAGLAIVALRRPWESRGVAVWALCLSLLSVVFSAGWLWWASTQGPLFG